MSFIPAASTPIALTSADSQPFRGQFAAAFYNGAYFVAYAEQNGMGASGDEPIRFPAAARDPVSGDVGVAYL